MKSQIKQLALLFLSMLFMFTSCQNESVEETDPTNGELVTQNSEVANLVLNMATRDGSGDNILDRNHCTGIKLPVTVVIKGIEITIDSEEDLETIERIFDEFEDDLDELDFLFPITVILADYSELVIENEDQLERLLDECEEDDDDIECIDFEYPITISVFDDNNEQIGTETFQNDNQLYRFFKNLKENEFVSFNFPMVLVDSEGEEVTITNNEELVEAIRVARNECDEDDDDDYNDDDFSIERFDNYLVECFWVVFDVTINGEDRTADYVEYKLDFSEDGSVVATRVITNEASVEGTWTSELTDRGVLLSIDMGDNEILTNQWLVYEIEEGKIKLYDEDSRIRMTRRCVDDGEGEFSEEELDAIIKECNWEVAAFNLNGNDVTAQYMGYSFTFGEDQAVTATTPGSTDAVTGSWSTQGGTNRDVFFLWDMAEPLQELMNDWKLYELDEERVKFIAGDSYVILERNCEGDNNDGDLDAIRGFMVQGEWMVADYDDSSLPGTDESNYTIYTFKFTEDGKMIATNPNMVETEGAYRVYRDEAGKLKFEVLDFAQPDLLELLDGDFYIVKAEENRLEIEVEYSESTKKVVYEKIQ
ncbi:hypothetical protein [Spongiivirga citrea]|uniref:Lipocalin-like domain-containing protein n=1 Tax=Spongiivirga citrea TaxID=1481457 RepID=A0A6M0CF39_9FLAO|nr:hypothetical protein [Spongiivirga citrea]NER16458.1 hypothetical protein [Spongiivirga citrea]